MAAGFSNLMGNIGIRLSSPVTIHANANSLVGYLTGTLGGSDAHKQEGSLGGMQLATRMKSVDPFISSPIPQISVDFVEPVNFRQGDPPHPQFWFGQVDDDKPGHYRPYHVASDEGFLDAGTLTPITADTLVYKAPGDDSTGGAAVTVVKGQTAVIESDLDESHAVVVTRDSGDDMAVAMSLKILKVFNNAVAMSDVSDTDRGTGEDFYRGLIYKNESRRIVSNLVFHVKPFTTATAITNIVGSRTGSGAYQQTLTNPEAIDWPKSGWCTCYATGDLGTILETVYYESLDFDDTGTPISMSVTADGRGRLGSSAGASVGNEDLYPVPGIRLSLETVAADGTIQTIADENTAPSSPAPTWNANIDAANGLTPGTLEVGESVGLWIHREIPANAKPTFAAESKYAIGFDWDIAAKNITILTEAAGLYRISDTSSSDDKEGFLLYVGQDAAPDFGAAPESVNVSLPFTYAAAAPSSGEREYRLIVRKRNSKGLIVQNVYERTHIIDFNGDEVAQEISAPTEVALTNVGGGDVIVTASYATSADSSPADQFNTYYTTTGVDPTTADTVVNTDMTSGVFSTNNKVLSHTISNLPFGSDLRVLVRAERTSDSTESINAIATQTTVDTATPQPVALRSIFFGDEQAGRGNLANLEERTVIVDAGTNVHFLMNQGKTCFYSDTDLIWCVLYDSSDLDTFSTIYVPDDIILVGEAISRSGTTDIIEVVSATEIYINVDGSSIMKIDLTAGEITCAQFVANVPLSSSVNDDAVTELANSNLFQVFDPGTFTYDGYLEVNQGAQAKSQVRWNLVLNQTAIEAL